jgi:putative tryptophan/tyrosine transport system substrate-binding protein
MTRGTLALLLTLALGLALVPLAADAPATHARIAVLGLTPAPPASAFPPMMAAFQQHLRALGWVEGQNLTIEWRWAEGSLDRFATLVAEMVRLPVEVMVVPSQVTAQLAQQATTTIPIIIVGGGSLAQNVPSLARPGGNVTGFANLGPELRSKQLELLTQVVAARALGVELQVLEARDSAEIDQAFAAAIRAGAGALVGVLGAGGPLSTLASYRAKIAELALTHRLPSIFTGRELAEAGGLMSYGPSPAERGQRLAAYVDKLLRGAKPGDLPIEQPTTFEFVINLKTAQALGLTIPPTLLFQADEVIR